jgi:hypothetical protein
MKLIVVFFSGRSKGVCALATAAMLGLTACSGPTDLPATGLGSAPEPANGEGAPRSQVVVAVETSFSDALNPYHEFFRQGGPLYRDEAPDAVTPEILSQFEIGPDQILDLTISGDPDADVAADAALFARIEPERFYWFRGTNLILYPAEADAPIVPGSDAPIPVSSDADTPVAGVPLSEATVMAASVLAANPRAVVVVFASGVIGSNNVFALAGREPGIDFAASFFDPPVAPSRVAESAAAVYESGKLLFAPTHASDGFDQALAASISHGHSGPWWMISVGGYEEDGREGVLTRQSKPYDLTANWALKLPSCLRCQTGGDEGLLAEAFGLAGHAAGVASLILQEARFRAGHVGGVQQTDAGPMMVAANGINVSNWQLRRALEVAAFIPSATDYDPTNFGPNPPTRAAITPVVPVPDDAPWTLAGWGLLSPDPAKGVVERALGVLGFGAAPPDKPPGFCEYMSTYMEARFTYWDAFPSAQPGRGQINGRDLYIGCESALP